MIPALSALYLGVDDSDADRPAHVWDDGTRLPVLAGFDVSRLLSTEQTCELLGGIPAVRLERWRREGRLGFVKLTGKTIAYPEDAVQAFIDANFHPATREPATTVSKPKSADHKRRISEAQKAAWARRKADAGAKS